MTKRFGLLLTLLVALGWAVLLRPVALGGPASYVIVSGSSMEPGMTSGDLAVLHRQSEYEVGDVVAFRTPDGGQIIHRIVGGNGVKGFVPRGDNRNEVDQWRPTHEDVLGSLWLHLPGMGDRLLQLREPQNVGILVAMLVVIGGVGTHEQQRRRRGGRRMRSPKQQDGPAPTGSSPLPPMPPALLGGIALAALVTVGSLAVAFAAFRSPAERTEFVERASYVQTGDFDYRVRVSPSTLYPTGTLEPVTSGSGEAQPPQPIFTRLAQDMTVRFDYAFQSAEATEVSGRLGAEVEVVAGDGWVQSLERIEPAPFTGNEASTSVTIDFAEVEALVSTIEEETGFNPGAYTLRVTPSVDVSADLGGEAVDAAYGTPFEVEYDRTRITPATTLTTTDPTVFGEDVVRANELSVLGVTRPIETWRWTSLGGAAFGAAAVAGLVAMALLGIGRDEETRIATRYRSMLVPVESNGSHTFDRAIHVASIEHLARIARRDGGVIFHEVGPYLHRYFVRDGEDTYDFTIRANRGVTEASLAGFTSDFADYGMASSQPDAASDARSVAPSTHGALARLSRER